MTALCAAGGWTSHQQGLLSGKSKPTASGLAGAEGDDGMSDYDIADEDAASSSASTQRVTPVEMVEVPDLDGLSFSEARRIAGSYGLRVSGTSTLDMDGYVVQQSPAAGGRARRGSSVFLTIGSHGSSYTPGTRSYLNPGGGSYTQTSGGYSYTGSTGGYSYSTSGGGSYTATSGFGG